MAYSQIGKERQGCNDKIVNDLRAGSELSGGQIIIMSGPALLPGQVNGVAIGWVGNYYNSGELVSLERDGRFNVKVAETLGAGIPVCPGANGTVEEFTTTRYAAGACRCGILVENITSGLYGAMESLVL